MASSFELGGVYVPLVTPLDDDGGVDLLTLEWLANHYLDAGLAGLVALGTTGEPATLTDAERQQVVESCAGVCASRGAQLIVGPGTNDTATTIAAVERLATVDGTVAALCVVPYYTLPGQDGIVAHFTAVADASPVPIVLYNIPSRTGQALEPEGMLQLAEHPNIVGVKQSMPLDSGTLQVLAEAPASFSLLCGEDAYIFPATLLGATGAITAAAHLCTERFVSMVAAGRRGQVAEGRVHHDALLPVIRAAFAEPSPSVIKGVLHRQGLVATPSVRLPLVPASVAAVDAALGAVAAAAAAADAAGVVQA